MEILNKITDKAFDIGELAIQAMLYETACYPSPGLVSPVSNGAHSDMNYYTFIKSVSTLSRYMTMFALKGYCNKESKKIFSDIRKIGIEAEEKMFKKTGQINTHKGMIFLLGISCTAVGKVLYDNKNFYEISEVIKEMTKGIVHNELINIDKNKQHTYGEELFLKYGIEGVRGEVERGLPTIFNQSLKVYEDNYELSENDRLVHTLIYIMAYCDDTTILHRHSIEELKKVQESAINIILLGGMKTDAGRKAISDIDKEFSKKRISPGGCADLLAATVFFCLIKEKYFTK